MPKRKTGQAKKKERQKAHQQVGCSQYTAVYSTYCSLMPGIQGECRALHQFL